MGFGLINLSATVIVSAYFEKKRAFALSITSCGSGVGTLIMAPIMSTLENNFGWGYTMMMIGALMLACVPFGLLFRPIATKEPEKAVVNQDVESLKMQNEINALDNSNDGNTGCSALHVKRLLPKYPAILHDPVFATCLIQNILTNVGFAIPYQYTVVSEHQHGQYSCQKWLHSL